MAGIMVSASTGVMNSLLGKLTTLMGEEFARLKNLRKEVKHISDELSSMKDALERLADVDELDIQTKRWRDTVREMSYDIEDIIDDFMLKIGDKNKKSGFVHKTIQRLKTSRARHQIAGQIEEIKKLVHETSERRERYKLHIPTSSDVAIDQRAVAIYANVANLVGMEGPTNELVNWLKDKEKKLKVVSIVGFGGLGKTTLANGVYHKLKGEFHCGGFVPVSQKPNISKLLRGLLFELGCEESIHNYELNVLLNKLRDHLKNKRYFIIIDDLWDVSAWDIIKCVFPENDLGSRVIVTTRIKNVAEACCSHHTEYILKMKPLSEEDSRKLFFDRIFGSQDACPGHLKDISIEILRKCGGLPLAIISISSILASENSNQKEMWEHVQTSLGSMSSTNLTLEGMRQILKLSYKNLPHHLKTCFLYLGMYPEDQTIYSFHLEGRWIAEGFVSKAHGRSAEQIARSYFNELVNRSLVQPVDIDEYGVFSCKVHDMMLDLILCMSAEENFITVVDNPEAITGLLQKSRRMLFYSHGAILPGDISMSQVRSLAIFRGSKHIPSLTEFKFLRVFFAEFPASSADANEKIDLTELSKLYQLRYLFIEGCHRCQLPTQIKGLQHLESFNIDDGSSIPSDIFQLPCLKRLAIQQAVRLPEGIGKMISLQVLFKFDMLNNSLDSINGLGELTNLNYLGLSSEASQDEMGTHMDVLSSSLRKLSRLEELTIRCRNSRILEQLTLSPPPCLLEKLDMEMSSRVPNWFSELHNLCYLTLTVVKLDKDGVGILAELPVLTDLNLVLKTAPEEIVVIYGTAFAVLKGFRMCCTESYSWLTFKAGAMPKLQRLSLDLNAKGRQNEAAPTGIEHLLALENINVAIFGGGATQSEERSVESAFRTAINMHPGHPRVKIQCGDRIGCAD